MVVSKELSQVIKLRRIMQTLRSSIGDNLPVQLVQTFLLVCEHEGKGVMELAELAHASPSTMSRHLLDLSGEKRGGHDGYGLLQRTNDPSNMKSVVYTVTKKGSLLARNLAEMMEE